MLRTVMVDEQRLWRIADRVGFWSGCALLLAQGITAVGYSWRFPVMDELSNYDPDMLTRHVSWHYLFRFHNEHGIFITRLLAWGMYRLFDSNPIIHTAFNYLIFVTSCLLLRHLLKRLSVHGTDILFCSMALPVAVDVHNWSFQTHFYATFLLFLAALWALSKSNAWIYFAGPLAILSCLSFSAGVAFSCAIVAVASSLAIWHPKRWRAYMSVVGACILGVIWYACHRPGLLPGHPPLALPWKTPFWAFMAVHIGGGMGWKGPMAYNIGWLLLIGSMASLAGVGWYAWRHRAVAPLLVGGVALGVLGALTLTSLGRAGIDLHPGLSSRYTTYTLFSVILIWGSQGVLFRGKNRYLAALGLLFLLPMVPKFQYQRLYRLAYNDNRDAERCAWAYYSGGNDGNCSAVLPWSSAGYLDNIWRIDTFAAKEFKQMHPGEPSRYDSVPRRLSERIMTTVTTLRLQRRPVLEYLTDAYRNSLRGLSAPALVPQKKTVLQRAA